MDTPRAGGDHVSNATDKHDATQPTGAIQPGIPEPLIVTTVSQPSKTDDATDLEPSEGDDQRTPRPTEIQADLPTQSPPPPLVRSPRPTQSPDGTLSALWRRTVPVGYVAGFLSFSTIAAPLLAGFSLTTIVTLSSSADHRGERGDIAIAAFSIAAVLMLFTLQSGIAASQRSIPVDQRAAQFPEARSSTEWMQKLREHQWRDQELAERLMTRGRWTYNIGIVTFLIGIVSVQIPSPGQWDDPHTGPMFRIIGLVAVAIALVVEVMLTIRRPRSVCKQLMPGMPDEKRSKVKKLSDMPKFDTHEAQRLVFDDDDASAAAIVYTLRSLVEHVARIDLAQRESERTRAADKARRRAAIEITGPYNYGSVPFGSSIGGNRQQWKIINRGPALATHVRMKILVTEGPVVKLAPAGQRRQSNVEEIGDLQPGMKVAIVVLEADESAYPVWISLSWTDDVGSHTDRRAIPYTQFRW